MYFICYLHIEIEEDAAEVWVAQSRPHAEASIQGIAKDGSLEANSYTFSRTHRA
ncbi:MAG: hypothetical protein AAFP07_05880 [Cyanobacteria bacterium J06606_4]